MVSKGSRPWSPGISSLEVVSALGGSCEMAGQHQHQQEAPPASQHQVSQVLQGRQRQGLSSVGQHPYLTVTVIYTVIYIVIVSITDIVTTTSQQRCLACIERPQFVETEGASNSFLLSPSSTFTQQVKPSKLRSLYQVYSDLFIKKFLESISAEVRAKALIEVSG